MMTTLALGFFCATIFHVFNFLLLINCELMNKQKLG
jgi:hypothetical protein